MVVIDYAHNKLSFDKFFENMKREFPDKKVIAVFGSAGGKAYSRRAEMAESAAKNAVYSIITDEDSGPEKTEDICAEIAGYIKEFGGKCEIVPDRIEAIQKAADMMDYDSILFISGKGGEKNFKRSYGLEPYIGDIKAARDALTR